jgi:hypothetical protein
MSRYFILLSLFLLNISAIAETCSPVDYRALLGAAHDQHDTPTCQSQAIADVISVAVHKPVSPMSVAARFLAARPFLYTQILKLEGIDPMAGDPGEVLREAKKRAVCTEQEVGDSENVWQAQIKEAVQLHQKFRETNDYRSAHANLVEFCGITRQIFPRAQLRNMAAILDQSLNTFDAFGAVLDQNCHELKGALDRFKVVSTPGEANPEANLNAINAALNSGQIPAVSMDARFFFGKAKQDKPLAHAVTVVQRKMVAGECRYLMRGSQGSSCDFYPAEVKARCEAGHFWLTKADMAKYFWHVSYLKAD